jgi:hypothetical protein
LKAFAVPRATRQAQIEYAREVCRLSHPEGFTYQLLAGAAVKVNQRTFELSRYYAMPHIMPIWCCEANDPFDAVSIRKNLQMEHTLIVQQ